MAEVAHGVVLAGGAGRRMGGAKSIATLGGEPLLMAPVRAMRDAGLPVSLLVKPETVLPNIGGVSVLVEPRHPLHPLVGIAHALRVMARPVVACAGDMPYVPSALFVKLATIDAAAVSIVDRCGRRPMIARFSERVLPLIDEAIAEGRSIRALLDAVGPGALVLGPDDICSFGDPDRILRDIDTPEQLEAAERDARRDANSQGDRHEGRSHEPDPG